MGKVVFDTMNVLDQTSTPRLQQECQDANIIWLNDYSWSLQAQQSIEATTLECMPAGSLLVMYRPPHFPPKNIQLMKTIPVATSWSPNLDMYIVYKEEE